MGVTAVEEDSILPVNYSGNFAGVWIGHRMDMQNLVAESEHKERVEYLKWF